jgi:hypothetical protein
MARLLLALIPYMLHRAMYCTRAGRISKHWGASLCRQIARLLLLYTLRRSSRCVTVHGVQISHSADDYSRHLNAAPLLTALALILASPCVCTVALLQLVFDRLHWKHRCSTCSASVTAYSLQGLLLCCYRTTMAMPVVVVVLQVLVAQ